MVARCLLGFEAAVKEKIDASALGFFFFFFLKSTPSQLWLLRVYEIVATFFGLWMRPQSSHTKFLVHSLRPNSPTRIVSRLSSRMWISMADGKPDEIANCIVTSCGFFLPNNLYWQRSSGGTLSTKNSCFWRWETMLKMLLKNSLQCKHSFQLEFKLQIPPTQSHKK